jgi:hypothetical protein
MGVLRQSAARLPPRAAVAAVLAVGVAACGKSKQSPADSAGLDGDGSAGTLLEQVAAIVIPRCAVAGCHDAISKTHAMDLSTAEKIHSNWVNVRGFDHCTNMDTTRVMPGDPDAGLVILKVEGTSVCSQSQRMPPPPLESLSRVEIDVIRAWITAGAPADRPPRGTQERGRTRSSTRRTTASARTRATPRTVVAPRGAPRLLPADLASRARGWRVASRGCASAISTRGSSIRAHPRRSCGAAATESPSKPASPVPIGHGPTPAPAATA